jgi:hypothetical protein
MTARMLLDVMAQGIGALEDQLEQARMKPEREPARARPTRTKVARSDGGASWYHNPWVIAIGGGAIATVVGGVILALVF